MTRTYLVMVLALAACGKKDDKPAAGGADKEKPAAPAGDSKKLKVGLSITTDGEIGEGMSPEGNMITGGSAGAFTVEPDKTPMTADEIKKDAADNKPKDLKVDTLPDGFIVTYVNTGSAGDNFWVDARRKIGGKDIRCSSTVSSADQQAAVVAACKSIK